jgi:acetyl esterase/lipase
MRFHVATVLWWTIGPLHAFQAPLVQPRVSLSRRNARLTELDDDVSSTTALEYGSYAGDTLLVAESDIGSGSRVNGWRKIWHNWLRDSGGLRLLMDTATRLVAAPQFYQEYPHCFPDFIRISGSEFSWLGQAFRSLQLMTDDQPDVAFSKESYGPHPMQQAQVMVNKSSTDSALSSPPLPLFFFLHGGAWGSGFPTMYRLISVPFLQRGYRAVVLGYRTYPDGKVADQVDDLAMAVDHFVQKYGGVGGEKTPVVLMGHSSGAHISLLAALKGRIPNVDAIIAASGVYDCAAQVEHEQTLEVDQLSPLSPVTGMQRESMNRYSPTWIVSQANEKEINSIPQLLLIHGEDDTVVLPSSSSLFYEKLQERQLPTKQVSLKILAGTDHKDPVIETLVGGQTQSVILEWLEETLQ